MPVPEQDEAKAPRLVLRSIYFPKDTDSRLRSVSFTRGISQGDLIRELVEQGLAAWKAAGGRTLAERIEERVGQQTAAKLGIEAPPSDD